MLLLGSLGAVTATDRDPDEPGLNEHSSIESVRALYDRWAGLYNWNPILDLVRPARKRTVANMGLAPGDTVVDMGTGTGANLPYLRAAVGAEGEIIGIDISPRMLQRARTLAQAEGWSNVTLVEGDIRDPPLDRSVDGILSAFVVVMYADPGQLVETWASYLDDGAMANLYAGPSTRPSAPVVNRLLNLYLRAFEEGWDTATDDSSPLDVLATRGELVREAMTAHTDRVEHDELVFGLAQLDVGRVEP